MCCTVTSTVLTEKKKYNIRSKTCDKKESHDLRWYMIFLHVRGYETH